METILPETGSQDGLTGIVDGPITEGALMSEDIGGNDVAQAGESVLPERGGIVTARGTGEGLILRLDGRVELESLKGALCEFLESRRSFLSGNPVALEWVGNKPSDQVIEEVSRLLSESYGIGVRISRLREVQKAGSLAASIQKETTTGASNGTRNTAVHSSRASADSDTSLGLFGGVESIGFDEEFGVGGAALEEPSELTPDGMINWDEPDARIVYATMRSGQKIESEHSLIVFGDVNSGAEVIAGGDVVVLGTLRGVAHAGAYDETGGGRFIFALNMQPTQLRIGSIISRSASEGRKSPEVARVDNTMIVVEPYNPRGAMLKRRAG